MDHSNQEVPSHHPPAPLNELFDVVTTVDPSYVISMIRKFLPPNPNISMELDHTSPFEECGCILWDLAANKTHAEFMVQNLVLEVILANLTVSKSERIKEICLGIIGNLACHKVPMKQIVATDGLFELIVDQIFGDDTSCLCESFRLLALALQGDECLTWAEALQYEHILSRILWVVENTLNPQLLGKSISLLLAIIESQLEVVPAILATLMKLGLPDLLTNLLSFEMNKLKYERTPERYTVLDLILRAIESLSTIDRYSNEIWSYKELFELMWDLVKHPDKVEVASSCVTAAVLIANILSDAPDMASDMSRDLDFVRGLFEILPFASDDLEAQSAIWNILGRLLVLVQKNDTSPSSLHQHVLVLVDKSEVIEDDILNSQLDYSNQEQPNSTDSGTKLRARNVALRIIGNILEEWATKNDAAKKEFIGNDLEEESIQRLLECCRKHLE